MSDETYNGWSNYPTWCVNMWLSNDEGLYNHVRSLAEAAAASEEMWVGVTDALEDFVKDLVPDLGASFSADLLSWALASVNWHEIAADWLTIYTESAAATREP